MSRAWFLQANPKRYDIDAALDALDSIWWRIPQYTSEVAVGDRVVIWRSGNAAGIVAVGRVISPPQAHPLDAAELPYVLSDGDNGEPGETTRAQVLVVKSDLIPKTEVQMLPGFAAHVIVTAPMGTVFPIDDKDWETLEPLLPAVPAAIASAGTTLPPTFAWSQRAKGVLPMPGGYDGFLDSLALVCDAVESDRPLVADYPAMVEQVLGVKPVAARLRASFLRKAGIISASDGACHVSSWAEAWRTQEDPRILVALLHGHCQLIGELLAIAVDGVSTSEALAIANDRFGMGWDTSAQISNRRGWLQSAGMLEATSDGLLRTTAAGRSLLAELTLQEPQVSPAPAVDLGEVGEIVDVVPPAEERTTRPGEAVVAIAEELVAAATDSKDPDRFERAVRDAFTLLGFSAAWLGGSGRTDVLVDAPLGKEDSYRTIVDCKTSGAGTVTDQQVDWVTLREHKKKHSADYVALVGPNPKGTRLFERAETEGVTVIPVDELVALCHRHAKAPIGVDDYRSVFTSPGLVDTATVGEVSDEVVRLRSLAAACCQTIRERSGVVGRLHARDIYLLLIDQPVAEATSEDEIKELLRTLAGPPIGILDGTDDAGYRMTSTSDTSRRRLEVLAAQLDVP